MDFYKPLFEQNFGKYLFGDFRQLPEPDTEEEREAWYNVFYWIKGHAMMGRDPGFQKEVADTLKVLKKVKKKYADILEPNYKILYRGISLEQLRLSSNDLPVDYKNYKIMATKYGSYHLYPLGTMIYKARGPAQSWTASLESAVEFVQGIYGYPEGLIYEYDFSKSPDQIIFNTNFLNKVFSHSVDRPGSRQEEIIRISNKTINCKVYYFKNV